MAFADSSAFKIQRKPINKSLNINILIKFIFFYYHHWNHIKLLTVKFDIIYILAFFHLNSFQSFTNLLYLHNIWITLFFFHLSTEALSVIMFIIKGYLNNFCIYCIAVIKETSKLLSLLKIMFFAKILEIFQKVSNILLFKQKRSLSTCQWHK